MKFKGDGRPTVPAFRDPALREAAERLDHILRKREAMTLLGTNASSIDFLRVKLAQNRKDN